MSELEAAVETLEAVPVDHADDVFANPELSAKMESSEDMDSMSDEISSVNEDSEVLDTPENRAYLNAVKERLKMMNTQYWDKISLPSIIRNCTNFLVIKNSSNMSRKRSGWMAGVVITTFGFTIILAPP